MLPQFQCCVTLSMSSFGSKVKLAPVVVLAVAVVEFPAGALLQPPTKVPFCLPDGAQLKTSVLAMLRSVKDGPVSSGGGIRGDAAYCRCQPSSRHDWYCFELSAQAELALSRAWFCLVVAGRARRLVVSFGVQCVALSAAIVQFMSRLRVPVARASVLREPCQHMYRPDNSLRIGDSTDPGRSEQEYVCDRYMVRFLQSMANETVLSRSGPFWAQMQSAHTGLLPPW